GNRLPPSQTATTTNREETINDAAPDLLAELIDAIFSFREPGEDECWVFFASADIPFSSFAGGGLKLDKMGYAIEGATLINNSGSSLIGLEYLINKENDNNLHGFIAEANVAKRLFNNFSWYLGGGIGLRFDFSNESNKPGKIEGIADSGYFAWKASTGFLINFKNIFTKIEASYNNVIGFSTSVGLGFGIKPR
ncbi:MAG: hypothetical protein IKI40_04445, partial [Treponema sp.]|nr:hypothetical protein [Treponema sp.]